MNDDVKEPASTSKNQNVKEDQGSDADKRDDDGGDSRMNSASSWSSSVSGHTRVERSNIRHKVPKTTAVKESKLPERRRKRRTVAGRIDKRMPRRLQRRVPVRRRMSRHRPVKRIPRHVESISTIFTRRSSRSVTPTNVNLACRYCGYRGSRRW